MTPDIEAIKARADKATAGPWANDAPACVAKLWPEGGKMTVATAPHETFFGIANAEFIAHARTDIPALIAAIEASETARVKAEQERDALKEALRQCISPIGGYAIKDSAQALEVVSDFLTQICRTSDIARRALEPKS